MLIYYIFIYKLTKKGSQLNQNKIIKTTVKYENIFSCFKFNPFLFGCDFVNDIRRCLVIKLRIL